MADYDHEKGALDYNKTVSSDQENGEYDVQQGQQGELKRNLKSRHMQMIAIGGAIGAGLFVGSGGALSTGGPASLLIGFLIVGFMLLCTVQALGELAVLYPVNGAFFTYTCRFVNPAWGFAMGWDYAIGWLTVLPFELTAACVTIKFWPGGEHINPAVWVTVFLVALCVIQCFGVRGYGEVEFVLAIIKIAACAGFIILAIIIDCGGVPGSDRGYLGAKFWYSPGAFANGFQGFASVFVTAAFAFGGTELTGLCAAEADNPRKSIPQATKQVFWRITFFYIVLLFLLGLVVPYDNENLLHASGANTKYSPFVIAIELAGIKVLPSIFNVCITVAVLSVANSCTYGSTRTIQALALRGMAPQFLAKVDSKGRPVPCIILQLAFGLLAYLNSAEASGTIFTWLLALSGLSYFFTWGSICLSHARFRAGWKAAGHSVDDLPFKAMFGATGSWIGFGLTILCLIAQFYTALFPIGSTISASYFFEQYLAAPVVIALFIFWNIYTWCRGIKEPRGFIRARDMKVHVDLRENLHELQAEAANDEKPGVAMQIVHALF